MEKDTKAIKVRPALHRKIKMAAAKLGKNMVDLIEEAWKVWEGK